MIFVEYSFFARNSCLNYLFYNIFFLLRNARNCENEKATLAPITTDKIPYKFTRGVLQFDILTNQRRRKDEPPLFLVIAFLNCLEN